MQPRRHVPRNYLPERPLLDSGSAATKLDTRVIADPETEAQEA
jgi:hypothetical protein